MHLTSLLESIAHIIDQHQPVVDKYYGPGRMRTVVGRLVGESDRVVRNLVEGWEEERRVGRLISETRASRFPLLSNPSLLPPLFASLLPPGAAGQQTPLSLQSLANTTSNLSSALQSYAPGVRKATAPATPVPQEEDAGPDPRDVDRVLGELVALGGRWALFRRFVAARLAEDEEGEEEQDTSSDVVEHSDSQRAIENLLKTYYEPLELWYLRSSVEKAHRLDAADTSAKPHLSSILDDTFYLIKVVLQRVLSSGSVGTLRSMRERIATVLEKDYAAVLSKKMDQALAQGTTYDRGEKERRERDQRETFVVSLANRLRFLSPLTPDLYQRPRHVRNVHGPSIGRDTRNPPSSVLGPRAILRKRRAGPTWRSGGPFPLSRAHGPRTAIQHAYPPATPAAPRRVLSRRELCARRGRVRGRRGGRSRAPPLPACVGGRRGWIQGEPKRILDLVAWLLTLQDAFTDHNYQVFFNMTVETLVRPWEKMVMGMQFTEVSTAFEWLC